MFIKTLKLKPRPLVGGILFAMSLMANAGITLTTGADTRLGEVISAIQSQSDYKFFYDDNIAKSNVRIVNLKDENVDEALKKLFDGTQIEYTAPLTRARKPRPLPTRSRASSSTRTATR